MTNRDKNIVGEVLAKTYRIERFLGVGTVGTVYVARHVRSGGLYAVKVLHRKLAASPDLYQRFQDEARLIATLRHPHIAPITDFDRDENGIPFFAMDLLEGENLQQRLKHKETLPIAQALEIVQQVGSALHTAHRSGIVHRNLKPENIYLVRHDLGDRVTETAKITDFGLARFRRIAPAGTRDAALGVSAYMAPETLQDSTAPIDGRADQWALAVIAYRMLSGKLPFDESSPEELLRHILNDPPRPLNRLLPDLPAHMVTALNRAMAKRREDRYETMMDFVRAFTSKSVGTAPPLPEGDAAAPQSRSSMPSGRVSATTPPVASGRVVAPAPPVNSGAVRPMPPIPGSAVPQVAPSAPSAPISVAPPVPPPAPAPPATPTPPATPAATPVAPPAAVAIPRAVPIPPAATLTARTPPAGSATTPPPPQLAAPELLLSDNSLAPQATPAKRPSWGLILGGTAIAILAGLGLTMLLDGRQHPTIPPGQVGQSGSETTPPTTPVVEALNPTPPTEPTTATPITPPPVDAAAHAPTPIAPHVPLPPLRIGGGTEGETPPPTTPSAGPAAGDPTKPAGVATPGGPEVKPGPPTAPNKPSGTATTTPSTGTAPVKATPPPSTELSRPIPSPPANNSGDPATGSATSPPSTPPPAEPKDKNADEIMKDAQAAYVRGERGRAMELALQVAEGGGPEAERAWRFIGSAACSVRNALMANKAYSRLESAEHKQMLLELCQRNGLGFQNGQFGPPAPAE